MRADGRPPPNPPRRQPCMALPRFRAVLRPGEFHRLASALISLGPHDLRLVGGLRGVAGRNPAR
jgi:hypothetical protein